MIETLFECFEICFDQQNFECLEIRLKLLKFCLNFQELFSFKLKSENFIFCFDV